MDTTMIYARVPTDVLEKVDLIAEDLGLTRSAVIRLLLKKGLDTLLGNGKQEFDFKLVRRKEVQDDTDQ